jgi:DNA-binding beta-propeller fold protein YncE
MKKLLFILLTAVMLLRCTASEERIPSLFYPMPPQQPRLQFLVSFTNEEYTVKQKKSTVRQSLQIKTPNVQRIETSNSNKIGRAYDIASVKGKIYISDRIYKKILIFNLKNKSFDILPTTGRGALQEPAGIWVTENDYKYIADFAKKEIVVFDNNNKFYRTYGEYFQLDKPVDVAVYQNRIYVCDLKQHQIITIDKKTGKVMQTIGGIGAKEGKFFKPTHVIVDSKGNIYVNDSFNFRIQKFDPTGKLLKIYGYHGDTLGGFARPKGIDIDREGHLFAVDAIFENVQIIDEETAELLLFFGEFGASRENMYLPVGIHIDYDNVEFFNRYADKDFRLKYIIYVSNAFGANKINVYGFGDWTGEVFQQTEKKIENETEQ